MKKYDTIFLDRDGTINPDPGYINSLNDFKFYDFTFNALKNLKRLTKQLCIITNQSGVARGLYSENDIKILHNQINKELKTTRCKIHDFFYCPYHPKYGSNKYRKNSYLRKPNPGMILKAVKKWNVDLNKSFMIGDKNFSVDGVEVNRFLEINESMLLRDESFDVLVERNKGIILSLIHI